jgi:GR25 family glycosyltransferase involved in LPS biosynthesis
MIIRKNIIILIVILIIVLFLYNTQIYVNTFENFTQKKGLDNTDAILYINLENREDRKKLILEELKKMYAPTEKIRKISGVHIPKNGHKGCIQSHILALQVAEMNDWDLTTIIEDDAELLITPEEFNNRLTNALAELKNKDWDVLMLCTSNKKIDETTKLKYVDKLKFATSGICYIIKKHYISKLLKLFQHCNTMMINEKWGDNDKHEPYALDQKWNELIIKDNWYALKGDNVIYQKQTKSSINNRI